MSSVESARMETIPAFEIPRSAQYDEIVRPASLKKVLRNGVCMLNSPATIRSNSCACLCDIIYIYMCMYIYIYIYMCVCALAE